jgi:hypothetical protein
MWLSAVETKARISRLFQLEQLDALFAFSLFWSRAVYSEAYIAHGSWRSILIPTDDGTPYIERARAICPDVPESDLYQALYCIFSHHAIFFDWTRSDLGAIQALLNLELKEYRIRLPTMFGRRLYDRFLDLDVHGRTEDLLYPQVKDLLGDSAQGIFQVGTWVSGPLGVLESREWRFIPPTAKIPLWHCSDTGCTAFHRVDLQQPIVPVRTAIDTLRREFWNIYGPRSEWHTSLSWRGGDMKWPKGRAYFDLIPFIADGILGKERAALVSSCLKTSNGPFLRKAIETAQANSKAKGGPPEDVANSLSEESQLQLLSLLPDSLLVQQIDRLLKDGGIRVCPGDIRGSRIDPPRRNFYTPTELGELGVRSVQGDPTVALYWMVFQGHSNSNMLSDLEWKIHSRVGVPVKQSLMQYIRSRNPADVIRDLILPTQAVTRFLCNELGLDVAAAAPDARFTDTALWKLGFNPPQFGDFEKRLLDRLEQFNQTLLVNTPVESEEQRERIRGSGVNLLYPFRDPHSRPGRPADARRGSRRGRCRGCGPAVGQQVVEALRRMGRQAREQVTQVGEGIELVALAG